MQSRLVVSFTIMYCVIIEKFLLHNVALINALSLAKIKVHQTWAATFADVPPDRVAASFLSLFTHVLLDKYIGGREI